MNHLIKENDIITTNYQQFQLKGDTLYSLNGETPQSFPLSALMQGTTLKIETQHGEVKYLRPTQVKIGNYSFNYNTLVNLSQGLEVLSEDEVRDMLADMASALLHSSNPLNPPGINYVYTSNV